MAKIDEIQLIPYRKRYMVVNSVANKTDSALFTQSKHSLQHSPLPNLASGF